MKKNNYIPKIGVVLCTYNGEKYIYDQLVSIISQVSVDLTVIIVDDNSTDNTIRLIYEKFSEYIDIGKIKIFINQNNIGVFLNFLGGINIALREKNFDYISLSDQDDLWLNNKLEQAVKKIQITNSDGYGSSVIVKLKNGDEKLLDKIENQKKFDYLFESGGPGSTIVMSNKLAQCIIVNKRTSQLNLLINHDWYIYAYARSKKFRWVIDSTPYLYYIQHDDNVMGANYGIFAKVRRLRLLLNKNFFRDAEKIRIAIGIQKLSKIDVLKNITKLRRSKVYSVVISFFLIFYL